MTHKQYYLMPIVLSNNERRFKYMKTHENPNGFGNYSGMDFGNENQALVSFEGSIADHDKLKANEDVYQFPIDLVTNVKRRDLAKLKKELNNRNFTSEWILANKPFGGVIRNIAKQCMVNQRFQGRYNSNIMKGKTPKIRGTELSKKAQRELNMISDEIGVARNNSERLEIHLKDLMEAIPTKNKDGKGIMIHGLEL